MAILLGTVSFGVANAQVTDDFNRADGALGANWTTNSGLTALTIVSNACWGGTGSSHNVASYTTGGTIAADQYAQVKVTTTGGFIGPVIRSDGGGNFYAAFLGGGNATIYRINSGTYTLVNAVSLGMSVNDVIYLEAVGSALTMKVNSVTVVTGSDSSITAAGYTGIDVYDNVSAVDDFQGGSLGGATPTPTPTSIVNPNWFFFPQ